MTSCRRYWNRRIISQRAREWRHRVRAVYGQSSRARFGESRANMVGFHNPSARRRAQPEKLPTSVAQQARHASATCSRKASCQSTTAAPRTHEMGGVHRDARETTVPRACQRATLGCASCRGRPDGCKRCITWRNEGRIPSLTSKSGYPLWTMPE